MKDQEKLIQKQDTQIIELNTRIKQLEMEKNELLKQQSEEQPMSLLPSIPSLSNIEGLPILDDAALQQLTNRIEKKPAQKRLSKQRRRRKVCSKSSL